MLMRTLTVQLAALLAVLFSAFFPGSAMAAAENYSPLMNKAGMQRMLSQRIAKAYMYNGQGISKQESKHQLEIALTKFEYNHAALKKVNDGAMQELLVVVQDAFEKYKQLTKQPYSNGNAVAVLEMSDMLLEYCQNVVLKLEELSGKKIDNVINLSGRQRMLAQRIAKYYIAKHAGLQSESSLNDLDLAISEFDSALKMLLAENRNTREIKELLNKMKVLWERISPYFAKVGSKGNPAIVLTTTDDITALADETTNLYVEVSAKASK